uniref:Uncharacterized protein n=1 Tax=Tanacetum cinerariifolium TaxID=118510 RepID=A0A6L2KU91_TANCI|nr:hypothetical protein [Tanacetum cinerariifolium]
MGLRVTSPGARHDTGFGVLEGRLDFLRSRGRGLASSLNRGGNPNWLGKPYQGLLPDGFDEEDVFGFDIAMRFM